MKKFTLFLLAGLTLSACSRKDTSLPRLDGDPLTDWNVLSYHHFCNGAGVAVGDNNNDALQAFFFRKPEALGMR